MSSAKELTIIDKVKSDPTIIDVQNRVNEVIAIRQEIFQKGVHFGPPYKGAKNDTLLKPGATFLQQKYGLREHHERIETTIHVDPTDLGKSYIIIQDRCRIFDSNGVELAQADAACTTFEDKYLYRGGGDRTCPSCGQPNIMRSTFAPRNNPNGEKGWYCNAKKGGCGANFDYNTPAIADQQVAKSVNTNPLNLLDTIVAMAQKRASVRSTIKATGVDALFSPGDGVTVDFYDDVFDGDDLTKSGDELIKVVEKHNAVISHVEPPKSDLAQKDIPTIRLKEFDALKVKPTVSYNGKTVRYTFHDTDAGKYHIYFGEMFDAENGFQWLDGNTLLVVDPANAAEAAKSALAGNGAPANGEKKVIGRWAFDRNALLTAIAPVASGVSYQERGATVKKMDDEKAFANCADIGEAVQLVLARLATHKKEAVS